MARDPSADIEIVPRAVPHSRTAATLPALAVGLVAAGAVRARHVAARARAEAHSASRRAADANVSIRQYADQVEQLAQDLEQFAYVASHDLSEPLRTVSSFVSLLEKRYADQLDDDAREFIGYAVGGTRRMQELLDDLLQYSRVGRALLKPVDLDLADATAGALAEIEDEITASNAQIEVGALPTVRADRRQMVLLLKHLLTNAIKFTDGVTPQVRVDAESTDGEWTISITDNGIGIDPGQAERIFKIFQRLHARDAYEGTGIGLALCQRIVDRMGGTIWVEPAPGGTGSRFRVSLPARRRSDIPERSAPSERPEQ